MNVSRYITVVLSLFIAGAALAEDSKHPPTTEIATFAGGCFWCMHGEFAGIDGVTKVVSGYTGGTTRNPTYEQVSAGNTGHIEAIEVTFNPAKVSYENLLDIFWENVDPLDANGQFCDKGSQYLAGVFYHNETQKSLAETSKKRVEDKLKEPVATLLRPAVTFYPAEDYHQDYYIKSKMRYTMYRMGCGRDERLEQLWGTKK